MSGKARVLKTAVKWLADAIATCTVVLPALCYWFSVQLVGGSRVFPGWSQLFSLIPGMVGVYVRRAFYRLILPSCGRNICISFGTTMSHSTVSFGNGVYVGVGCMLGDVMLDDDVLVGSHVSIINGRRQHRIDRLDIPVREQPGVYPRVTVGQDTWIGDRAIVTADVGKHCVIGAGAVVTQPVPDYAIVVGNPARIQGFREQTAGSMETDPCPDVQPAMTSITDGNSELT